MKLVKGLKNGDTHSVLLRNRQSLSKKHAAARKLKNFVVTFVGVLVDVLLSTTTNSWDRFYGNTTDCVIFLKVL